MDGGDEATLMPATKKKSRKKAKKKRAKKKAVAKARPTLRTPEVIEEMLEHISDGKTLRSFCKGGPFSVATAYRWLTDDPDLARRFARARLEGCIAIEEEMMEIADNASEHEDDVRHRKLQLWMREKRLIWADPAKYGTKVQQDVRVEHTVLSETERKVRIAELLAKAGAPRLELDVVVNSDEDE